MKMECQDGSNKINLDLVFNFAFSVFILSVLHPFFFFLLQEVNICRFPLELLPYLT